MLVWKGNGELPSVILGSGDFGLGGDGLGRTCWFCRESDVKGVVAWEGSGGGAERKAVVRAKKSWQRQIETQFLSLYFLLFSEYFFPLTSKVSDISFSVFICLFCLF